MKIKTTLLLLALSLPLSCYAKKNEQSSQEIYEAMNHARAMHVMATSDGQCPSDERYLFMNLCATEHSKNESRLREILYARAEAGEPVAMFYKGLMLSESGAHWINSTHESGVKARIQSYETAAGYYKKACAASISDACWNLADIYAKGLGETKSGLAAAEWYYKAGLGYLANGKREKALAALEEIEKIDPKNSLASKLKAQLQKGAPK